MSGRYEHDFDWDGQCRECGLSHLCEDVECPVRLRAALDDCADARDKLTHAMVGAVAKRMEVEAERDTAKSLATQSLFDLLAERQAFEAERDTAIAERDAHADANANWKLAAGTVSIRARRQAIDGVLVAINAEAERHFKNSACWNVLVKLHAEVCALQQPAPGEEVKS